MLENPVGAGLKGKQLRAAEIWDGLTRTERAHSIKAGVVKGIWEDNWVGHYLKDPNADIGNQFMSTRRKAVTAKRTIPTLDEFEAWATGRGLEVQSDPFEILRRRLDGTAALRTERVFVEGIFQKVGKAVKPGDSPPPGYTLFDPVRYPGWAIPNAEAGEMRGLLTKMSEPVDEAGVTEALELMTGTLLNLDASGLGRIQGFIAFSADPIAWAQGMGETVSTLMTKEGAAFHLLQNADIYSELSNLGLQLHTSAIDLPIRGPLATKRHLIERVPVVAQMNEVQFNRFIPFTKAHLVTRNYRMLQALRDGTGFGARLHELPGVGPVMKKLGGVHDKTNQELFRAATESANNTLGGVNWAEIGVNPRNALRRLMFLTEGWLRAQVGLMGNAFRVGDPRGILARKVLMQELVAAHVLSIGASLAWTGEMPELDPRKSDWLNIRAPWGSISWLPHKAVIRSVIVTLAGKHDDPFNIETRIRAIQRYSEARVGLVPGLFLDVASGRDFLGREIENNWEHIGIGLTPIIVQEIYDTLKRGERDPLVLGQRIATEFVGASSIPFTASQKLRRLYEKEQGDGAYDRDSRVVRDSVISNNEEMSDLRKQAAKENDERGFKYSQRSQEIDQETEFGDTQTPKVKEAADAVLKGTVGAEAGFVTARADALEERALRKSEAAAEEGLEFKDREADIRTDAYYGLQPTDRNGNGFIDDLDMRGFFEERDKLFAALTPEEQRAMLDPATRWDDGASREVEGRYQDAVESRDAYFKIPRYNGLSLNDGLRLDQIREEINGERLREAALTGEVPDDDPFWKRRLATLQPALRTFVKKHFIERGAVTMTGFATIKGFHKVERKEEEPLNPERVMFRLQHQELFLYFPGLFAVGLETAATGLVEPQALEAAVGS